MKESKKAVLTNGSGEGPVYTANGFNWVEHFIFRACSHVEHTINHPCQSKYCAEAVSSQKRGVAMDHY